MKVTLMAYTPNAELIVAHAGRVCYSADGHDEINEKMNTGEIDVGNQLNVIHGSCYEHATFTFGIEGISRDCSHQLVRHRLASFSQQSQRYVKMDGENVYCPKAIAEDEELRAMFRYITALSFEFYERLMDHGVKKEDARYVLPGATTSNIVVTMNARELMHFFGLRCCTRAQFEIRELADKMLDAVKEVAPMIFRDAGPQCKQLGYCPEHKSCGKYPKLNHLQGDNQ